VIGLAVAFLFLLISALLSFLLGIGYFLKRKSDKPAIPKIIIWTFGISTALSLLLWFSAISPLIQKSKQVRTIGDMGYIVKCLESYQQRHGDFPARFTDAMPADHSNIRDGWNNPFHYEHRPGAFILVSFGSDGRPDGADYWELREENAQEIIGGRQIESDQVLSDRACHRVWSL
jgi:hypothetical protein